MGDASETFQLSLLKHDVCERRGCCCQYAGWYATAMATRSALTATLEEVEEEGGRVVEIQSLVAAVGIFPQVAL